MLAVREYHVTGSGSAASGLATLGQSAIEGATIGEGTVVEFSSGKGPFTYAGRGSVSGMNLPRLGRALRVPALEDPKLDGTVNGAFDVRGSGTSLDEMTLDATGTLTDTTAYGTHLPEMAFAAKIAGRGLTVAAKGNFDAMNPAVISDRRSLDGNVSGSVDATVRVADLSAPITPAALTFDGQVSLAPSLLGSVQIAGADVVGHYEAEVADLQRLQLKGPDVTVDASGRLALDRTSESNLKFRIDAPDISEAGQLVGQESLDGGILVDGVITGNAARMQASGTYAGRTLAYTTIKALDAKGKYDVVVPDLDFVNATVNATTDATFVEIAGTELNQVTATTTYAKRELVFATHVEERTRELDAKGRVVFHPDHQEIHLPDLAIRTEGIEWTSVPGGDPRVQYRPGEVTLTDIRLQSGDQRFDIAGTVAVGTERPAGNLLVNATNVDLAQVERLLLQNRGLQGRLTAKATIAGTTNAPVVDGHVEITAGAFQGYKYDSLIADIDYEGRKIALDATLQQAPGVAITAKGVVPTSFFEPTRAEHIAPTAEDAIDLRIQTATLNLGILQGLTTHLTDVGGILQADIRVTGSGRDPHFIGFVEIRDGAFTVPRVGTAFAGLDTRIDLEEDVVRLRRFEILDENGEQLVISGQLATHERTVGAVDLTIESSNFEIVDNELGDIGIGTQLKVTGQLSRPRIEGEIRLATGRLEVDRILTLFYDPYRVDTLPEVVSAERTAVSSAGATEATRQALAGAAAKPATAPAETTEKAAPAEGGIFENLAMQVHLRIPDNLVVRGRRLRPGGPTRASIGDINLTIGGDLDVRKEPGDSIRLIGTVNTVRGTYQFQGRQFDLARNGIVRFIGDDKLDPTLDITATREIPDTGVEARVKVTGTVSAPELQLSSVPPLEESDILALIVFNRSVNDLGTGERASLAATAGGIATGFIATPLGESIGRALDLDLFEISAAAEGDTLGATLTVGDQIGDRTFVKLRQQFGERSYSEFLLEYQIADFLRLAGSLAPETAGTGNRLGQRRIERVGIDLIFFFSY
jgi:translocation and assembly module TamB